MRSRLVTAAVALGLLAAAAASAMAAGGTAASAAPAPPRYRHVCAATAPPGSSECLALLPGSGPAAGFGPATRALMSDGYQPRDLRAAYHLAAAAAASGTGQTVAVVDAYDDPDAAANLTRYRAKFGLPPCASATGCFTKVNQEGAAGPLPQAAGSTGWATEESLDLDMVSAICPRCHIILVEAGDEQNADLGRAVDTAVRLGARFVSNSYGGDEYPGETTEDGAYYDHPGVVVTASAGDSGYGVEYPAASPYVTAVGGTSLRRDASARRRFTETVWGNGLSGSDGDGTGSGCSAFEPKPSWQRDSGCARRTAADVSADADPGTGVLVYDTYDQSGWGIVGGTSVAAPIIAATYALAGRPGAVDNPARYPYAHARRLYDVTSGSDGSCGGSYLCEGGPGYDGPTGLGTPDGTGAFKAVDNAVTVASPGRRVSHAGRKITPVRMSGTDTLAGQRLSYSAAGLPAGLKISKAGVISGTPARLQHATVTVTATDNTGASGTATFAWDIELAARARWVLP